LGATATAAKLLSLSVDQTMHALGIAASAASGLRANVASMTNLYHVGHAAEQGILAALLARRGWTSSENSLEGPNGFFQVLAGGHSAEASVDQLGRAWAMLTPGVSRKRYPTCGAMHPTFDAVLDIVRSENIRSEDVESIHCKTTPAVIQLLTCVRPTTQVEARFSLPFAAAIALLDRCVGPEQVTDEKVRDPRIRELMKRVVIEVDPEYIGRFDADFTTTVTLSLRDSRKLQRRVEAPRGPMTTTMTQEDVNEKFRLCAAQRLDPLNTARVLDVLKHFEEEKDIRGLMRMIS